MTAGQDNTRARAAMGRAGSVSGRIREQSYACNIWPSPRQGRRRIKEREPCDKHGQEGFGHGGTI